MSNGVAHLDRLDSFVAVNLSPRAFFDPRCPGLLEDLPLDRVVLELSEHEPVEDYEMLAAVLAPFRSAGLRLASTTSAPGSCRCGTSS